MAIVNIDCFDNQNQSSYNYCRCNYRNYYYYLQGYSGSLDLLNCNFITNITTIAVVAMDMAAANYQNTDSFGFVIPLGSVVSTNFLDCFMGITGTATSTTIETAYSSFSSAKSAEIAVAFTRAMMGLQELQVYNQPIKII